MTAEQEKKIKEQISLFVGAICELSKANRLTGIWDNRRFQECNKPMEQADLQFVYKSEKLSRNNVELRGVHRKTLDLTLGALIQSLRHTKPAGNA